MIANLDLLRAPRVYVQTDELQLLTISVADQEFGVDILKVQQILVSTEQVRLPDAPGVINFRGRIIPLFDLKEVFKLPFESQAESKVIIVVGNNHRTFGLIGDRVNDLIHLPESKLFKPSQLDASEMYKFLQAVGKVSQRTILVLDLSKLIDTHEINRD